VEAPKAEVLKAAPKPAAAAQAAPSPARTPDVFEKASGGGKLVPSSGGSSFTSAPVTAANAAVKDAVGTAKANIQGVVNNTASNVVSAANTSVANTLSQVPSIGAPKPADLQALNQLPVSQNGFGGLFDSGAASDFQDFGEGWQDFSNPFGSIDLGGFGGVPGGTGGIEQIPGVTPASSPERAFGGAPGGVGERPVAAFSLADTFSKNFAPVPGMGRSDPYQELGQAGGGSKPGLGGGVGSGLSFLSQLGGGAFPVSSSQPSTSILPSASGSSSSHGHHWSHFNFGSRGSGGGGAPGGVAERWNR
jgi:hypothetical protein